MRMRLESGGERSVRDNRYIAVFMMSDVRLSLYFLALTTPMTEIITVLHKLKVPVIITELMVLIYRFIFVFMETATTIRRAQLSRSGYVSMKSSFRSLSRLSSALLGEVFRDAQ